VNEVTMEQKELAEVFLERIAASIDRILATMDGLTQDDINWRPPAEKTNSLYVLGVHTIAYTAFVISTKLCGKSGTRDAEAEFSAVGESVGPLRMSWQLQRKQLSEEMAKLPPGALDKKYDYTNRNVSGIEVLLILARHAHEHVGHAELTRDLLKASKAAK